MSVISLSRGVIGFLILITTTGCFMNNVREVDPDQAFFGLSQVYTADIDTLNVVFVHGMGHHPFGEEGLHKYQIKIAGKLGFDHDSSKKSVSWGSLCERGYEQYRHFTLDETKTLTARSEDQQAICPLRINNVIVGFVGWRQYSAAGKTLNLFELSWDRATELLQKSILELDDNYFETVELDKNLEPNGNGRNREADRAYLNRLLKKFVNQNLGDPAIYLGSYGDSIRRTVADGLTKIATKTGADKYYRYSIISDSLGSRIVFDTLGCVLGRADDKNMISSQRACAFLKIDKKLTTTASEMLPTLAGHTSQIFMNANQLPFLALSYVAPPRPEDADEKSWLKRFPCETGMPGLTRYQDKSGPPLGKPVQIVAFTDPNDALSYHLTKRFQKQCTHLSGKRYQPIKITNVRVSNVKWDFGIFANPQKAHSGGFRTNKAAIDMLVNGYTPTGK